MGFQKKCVEFYRFINSPGAIARKSKGIRYLLKTDHPVVR
ncbi:hypothetical protein SYNPCC7002_A2138 [Picosynechococcus sp. PCC 7002]|nr:hypothetical protein SYNPCC7002_A2138 [Picosynechococcus sp. PCC 7002]